MQAFRITGIGVLEAVFKNLHECRSLENTRDLVRRRLLLTLVSAACFLECAAQREAGGWFCGGCRSDPGWGRWWLLVGTDPSAEHGAGQVKVLGLCLHVALGAGAGCGSERGTGLFCSLASFLPREAESTARLGSSGRYLERLQRT